MCKNISDLKVSDLKTELLKYGIEAKNLKKVLLIELLTLITNSSSFNHNITPSQKTITTVVEDKLCKECEVLQKSVDNFKVKIKELIKLNDTLEAQVVELTKIKATIDQKNHQVESNIVAENLKNKSTKYIKDKVFNSNVLILADSHGRQLAGIISDLLPKNFTVQSIFKPNARFEEVVKNCASLATNFAEMDHVIVFAGCNNALQTGKIQISSIESTLNALKHTNTYFVSIPYFKNRKILNNIIYGLNTLLYDAIKMAVLKKRQQVRFLDINLYVNQHHFTNHGLHLRQSGKLILSNHIVSKICHVTDLFLNKSHQAKSITNTNLTHIECDYQPKVIDCYEDGTNDGESESSFLSRASSYESINSTIQENDQLTPNFLVHTEEVVVEM